MANVPRVDIGVEENCCFTRDVIGYRLEAMQGIDTSKSLGVFRTLLGNGARRRLPLQSLSLQVIEKVRLVRGVGAVTSENGQVTKAGSYGRNENVSVRAC